MSGSTPGRIRPGFAAALAALVTVLACQRGADDGDGTAAGATPPVSEPAAAAPRLAQADTGPVLALPPIMSRALAGYAPEFSPWRRNAYDAEVLAHFPDPIEPLFGAVGDFNGDGRADVALQGFTPREELFFVLLSAGDTARVVELRRRELFFAPRGLQRDIYLRAVPAGARLDVPAELGQPPALRNDAFMEVIEGSAAVLYYWTGERFATYVIGD